METELSQLQARLVIEGWSPETDAKLFEYLTFWVDNNQYMQKDAEVKYDLFVESYGFQQYLVHGDILIEED